MATGILYKFLYILQVEGLYRGGNARATGAAAVFPRIRFTPMFAIISIVQQLWK
jgi:hypothetical protein